MVTENLKIKIRIAFIAPDLVPALLFLYLNCVRDSNPPKSVSQVPGYITEIKYSTIMARKPIKMHDFYDHEG